jgi:hypothetical protein
MIITMRLGNQTVTAGCPSNSLVFDGKKWAKPRAGNYATLIYTEPTIAGVQTYPVNDVQVPGNFRLDTRYECLIVSVDVNAVAETALMSEQDPLNGSCPCLVCNLGTELINVKVISK